MSKVDVLLVGGGPVSLLLTSILVRSELKVLTVEQYDKFEQGHYGRACVLYPGSLEILELLGVYERIADIGFIIQGTKTFKDGAEINGRGWSFIDEALRNSDTMFKFWCPLNFYSFIVSQLSFGIRQKHLEDVLRDFISKIDTDVVKAPAKLLSYRIAESSEYPVIATIDERGHSREIQCKYLVGADGGRSTVRSLGNFPFPGTASPHKWIRLDAIVVTNMPSSRCAVIAIESKKYGNILWSPIDNGRTRLGFVCPDEISGDRGSKITEEVIMAVAKQALQPFTLEFVKLDWWTVYEIGQRVAETFKSGPVFLAGDAAHTHSSGAAQGMNTGIHDAVNLGWKLAGVLGGLYHEDVLDTYTSERRASAQRVIDIDRNVAAFISGHIPAHFGAPPNADANEYLDRVFSANAAFTVGLGVSYSINLINRAPTTDAAAKIGHRAPDGPVLRPGRRLAQPLRSLVRYTGRFWALVFAGILAPTPAADFRALRAHVDSTSPAPCEFLTLLAGPGCLQPAEALGAQPLGNAVYDPTGEVFAAYGVDGAVGGIVVVRPDGIISFKTTLDGVQDLVGYFAPLVRQQVGKRLEIPVQVPADGPIGGENNVEGGKE
ncbi:FAD binding domain-containing protein [Mycena rosella]|uniref:FAD binding domain-containing protein n=1 Tax=Mycena rosella TaxID=1033263 RepID=A0AAD7GQS8_MYCRO|nr:FAD binding domain-containing protein [Mycena rosella]